MVRYQGGGHGNAGAGPYVLASTRAWNQQMAEDLASRVGADFIWISDPDELTYENLVALNPQFVFLPHWSSRINASVHERFPCVIFHMTDVPWGRGGSPLQNLIVRGIYETKISALRCVEEMDAGPVYLKRDFSLHGAAEEIFLRAAEVIQKMIVEIIEKRVEPKAQEGVPTTFRRRQPEEGDLAAASSLTQVFDIIRMLDAEGYPKAFLEVGDLRLELTRASIRHEEVLADVRIRLRSVKHGDVE